MKNNILFCFVVLLSQHIIFAQCGDRYLEDISSTLITHKDIKYGNNLDSKDVSTDLLLDVYEPENDTLSLRPLMIFVHGGSFIGGSRTDQSIDENAKYFARKGYVTANIEYRVEQTNLLTPILNFADKNNWYKAMIRVVHDINATIRFFKKDVAENGNIYRIDTSQIILYGSSAGAIACLHSTYIDDLDEASVDFRKNFLALGGLEGNSGNAGYTSRNSVKAIVSCSGAIDNLNYLNNNKDIKFIAFHHGIDLTVPYDKGCFVTVACHLNQFYGSKQIAQRQKTLGATYEFYTFDKIDHPADKTANAEDRAFLLATTATFLHNNVVCNDRTTPIKKNNYQTFNVYPNPTSNQFFVDYDNNIEQKEIELQIINIVGEKVLERKVIARSAEPININLEKGMYTVRIVNSAENTIYISKLMVTN